MSIFIKSFWNFFWWKIWHFRFFFSSDHNFCKHIFWARMRCLKNGWPLSAPSMAYFYHSQLIGIYVREWQLMSAFTKKLKSFYENWRNISLIGIQWALLAPLPFTFKKSLNPLYTLCRPTNSCCATFTSIKSNFFFFISA